MENFVDLDNLEEIKINKSETKVLVNAKLFLHKNKHLEDSNRI